MYATSQSLIVIAPLLVAAGNYLMLGRLMLAVLPVNNNKILNLKPTLITKDLCWYRHRVDPDPGLGFRYRIVERVGGRH